MRSRRKSFFRRPIFIILMAVLIVFLGFLLTTLVLFNTKNSQNPEVRVETVKKVEPKKPDHLEVNKMYFGDVFWGRYVNDWAEKSPLKEAYPFSGLHTFEREKYQAWIGSLNCPITDRVVSSAAQDETLTFNCTPNYLPEAKKWFNIFSLANSHTDNQYGMEGFNKTRKYLDETGIQYFGHYNKDVTEEICEVVTINAKATLGGEDYSHLTDTNYDIREFSVPMAMCGFHNTFKLPTEEQLDEIAKYSSTLPTFVYAIQGKEYPTVADDLQRKYFRAMIDRGADAVIGKGAHVVQDTESYKGKPIIYSMGNFVYDQQFSKDVTQGIGVSVRVEFIYDDNLEKWQILAASCKSFKDTCLTEAKKLGLTKPDYKITYDIVASDNSGKLAKKASQPIQNAMLTRTMWADTLAGLK